MFLYVDDDDDDDENTNGAANEVVNEGVNASSASSLQGKDRNDAFVSDYAVGLEGIRYFCPFFVLVLDSGQI